MGVKLIMIPHTNVGISSTENSFSIINVSIKDSQLEFNCCTQSHS